MKDETLDTDKRKGALDSDFQQCFPKIQSRPKAKSYLICPANECEAVVAVLSVDEVDHPADGGQTHEVDVLVRARLAAGAALELALRRHRGRTYKGQSVTFMIIY